MRTLEPGMLEDEPINHKVILAHTSSTIDGLTLWSCVWAKDNKGYYAYSENGYEAWRDDFWNRDAFWKAFEKEKRFNPHITPEGEADKTSQLPTNNSKETS